MKTVGIDIAGENSPNGICVLDWTTTGATVTELKVENFTIPQIVEMVKHEGAPGSFPIGIDAPFGFPVAFIDAVTAMQTGSAPPTGNPLWRVTENYVKTTKNALSSVTSLMTNTVSGRCFPLRYALVGAACADLIGYSTRIFEVYPAAALVSWDIQIAGNKTEPSYKRTGYRGARARKRIVADLVAKATCGGGSWLQIADAPYKSLLADRGDAIDALVSALVARIAAIHARPTDPADAVSAPVLQTVTKEGWIHLPAPGSLRCLAQTSV